MVVVVVVDVVVVVVDVVVVVAVPTGVPPLPRHHNKDQG